MRSVNFTYNEYLSKVPYPVALVYLNVFRNPDDSSEQIRKLRVQSAQIMRHHRLTLRSTKLSIRSLY